MPDILPNQVTSRDAAMTILFHIVHPWHRAAECGRWLRHRDDYET